MRNLDDSGATLGKDVNGISTCKRVRRRNSTRDLKMAQLKNVARVIMMPCISAVRHCAPPLFVFKVNTLPYWRCLRNGRQAHERAADVLLCHLVVALREQNGNSNRHSSLNWGMAFAETVKDLSANNRKLVLTCHAHRSHTILDVRELFNINNIIVYGLPAHTSGKTRPVDVVMFSPFKGGFNESINIACSRRKIDVFNVFDLCDTLAHASQAAFTKAIITTAF